jgi:NAD(P)-dependent dehydrogenase (short-subunit alcohol dehydrogenase family)
MKTLVTGGAGYVGNLLCKALLEAGHEVTAMDISVRIRIRPSRSLPRKFHILSGHPVNDPSYLKGIDVVFHLAGLSGYPACEANPNSAQLINVDATRQLVNNLAPGQLLVSHRRPRSMRTRFSLHRNQARSHGGLYSSPIRRRKYVMERPNSISLRWATVLGVSSRAGGPDPQRFRRGGSRERWSSIPLLERTFMHVRDLYVDTCSRWTTSIA